MPWYHVIIHHGPGHQSTYEFYGWVDKEPITKAEKEGLRKRFYDGYEGEPMKIIKVRKLPEEIREEKIIDNKYKIKYHKKILKILEKS